MYHPTEVIIKLSAIEIQPATAIDPDEDSSQALQFIQKKIVGNLGKLLKENDPLDFADHLIYHEIGQFRFRMGDYRIIFDVDGETLKILSVGHKREIYE